MSKMQVRYTRIIAAFVIIIVYSKIDALCQANLCINGSIYANFQQHEEEIRHVAFSSNGYSTFIDGEFQKIILHQSDSLLVFDSYLNVAPELVATLRNNFNNICIYENKYLLIRHLEIQLTSLKLQSEFRFDPEPLQPNSLMRSIKKWRRSIKKSPNEPSYESDEAFILNSRKMYLMAFILMNTKQSSACFNDLFHNQSFLSILGPEYGEEGMAYLSSLQEFNLMPIGEGYTGDHYPCTTD